LALTFSDQGVSVRSVGSRKTPWEMSWNSLLCHVTGQLPRSGTEPTAEDVAAALELLKKGAPSKPSNPAAPSTEPATTSPPPAGPAAGSSPPSSAGQVGSVLARLEKWLAGHRPRYHEGLLPGASATELDAAQAALGRPLPLELRALLSWHNGQSGDFVGHLEHNWDLMNTSQITVAKQELDDSDRAQTGWEADWIPFLDDNNGDYVCVDTGQPGGPVREFWQGKRDHPVVAPSLAAWLEQYVSAVEQGAYHEDPERGTFIRSRD
jgi:cell wall assembly regulator SMI1